MGLTMADRREGLGTSMKTRDVAGCVAGRVAWPFFPSAEIPEEVLFHSNHHHKEGLNDDTEVLDEFCIVPIASMIVTAKRERENWLEY